MQAQIKSQTWSGQPPDPVTSPKDFPRRFVDSRQDNAVVSNVENAGSPITAILVANGNQHATSFEILKCNSTRCRTCP